VFDDDEPAAEIEWIRALLQTQERVINEKLKIPLLQQIWQSHFQRVGWALDFATETEPADLIQLLCPASADASSCFQFGIMRI
jgi:hypothetical protein